MKTLIFAPHPDDEVLGVGGTIAKRVRNDDVVYVCIVTRGVEPLIDDKGVAEVRQEAKEAHSLLGIKETIYLDFPAAMLETAKRYEMNARIFDVICDIKPNEVFIPHWGDMQKDHQIVSESVMVALRPKNTHVVSKIYAYETLSETGWNIPNGQNAFVPNAYFDISGYINYKIDAMKKYASQLSEFPHPRSVEAIEVLAKYRGSTINVPDAEAFVIIREIG
jgi:LmbE family N-acetylglucosaminyl deacetylase